MWRTILAVVLLPALTAAQTPAPSDPPTPKPSDSAPAATPNYRHFAVYDAIRQGTDEEMAISFLPGGFITVPKTPVSGVASLKLELQPVDGLTITKVEYPKPYARKVTFQPDPIQVVGGPVIRLKVRADRNATPGAHVLTGQITFQPIHTDSTVGPVQQLDVQIPITVVPHSARVQKELYPYARTSPALIALIIVLLPVAIVLFIPYMLICGIGGAGTCTD